MLCCIGEFGSASGMWQRLRQHTGTSINSTINISYTGKLNFAIWLWKEQTINRTPEQPQKPQGRDCWAVWSCRWQLWWPTWKDGKNTNLCSREGKREFSSQNTPGSILTRRTSIPASSHCKHKYIMQQTLCDTCSIPVHWITGALSLNRHFAATA